VTKVRNSATIGRDRPTEERIAYQSRGAGPNAQERYADLVVSFTADDRSDPDHLDAELTLRDGLPHPDLSPFTDSDGGITLGEDDGERVLRIPGQLGAERAAEIEQAIWEKMQFASHLRSQRLGEFTIANDLHRSESLALVQLLILYHLVTARATVALGGEGGRSGAGNADADLPAADPASSLDSAVSAAGT